LKTRKPGRRQNQPKSWGDGVHGEKVSPFLLGNNSQLECAYKTVPFQAAPLFKLRLNFRLLARKVFKNSGVCPFQAGAACLKTSATDPHTTEVFDLLLKHPSPCNETVTNLQISIFEARWFCFVLFVILRSLKSWRCMPISQITALLHDTLLASSKGSQ
jgi:hypothetical protein